MDLRTHDRWHFPLPQHHRFPIAKYPLLRRRIVELGLATAAEIHETDRSPELVERGGRAVAGTVAAAQHALAHGSR